MYKNNEITLIKTGKFFSHGTCSVFTSTDNEMNAKSQKIYKGLALQWNFTHERHFITEIAKNRKSEILVIFFLRSFDIISTYQNGRNKLNHLIST